MLNEQYLMKHFHYEFNPSKFTLLFSIKKENKNIEKITDVFLIYGNMLVPLKILKLNTKTFSEDLWNLLWEIYYIKEEED